MRTIEFKDWAWQWLESKEQQIKQSSIATYSAYLRLYLIPAFGSYRLSDLDTRALQKAVNCWRESGLSSGTIQYTLGICKSILIAANGTYRTKTLNFNEISLAQDRPTCVKMLTRAEQKRLCQYVRSASAPKALAVGLAIGCGLRIGEACGVQWADIGMTSQSVSIKRTIQRIPRRTSRGPLSKVAIAPPKTPSSLRVIPIPQWLFDVLREQRRDSSFFVASGSPKYIEPRTLRAWYARLQRQIGLNPTVPFHGLRHSYATRCIESGLDAKAVSTLLGHANVHITLDRYMHPSHEYLLAGVNRAFGEI